MLFGAPKESVDISWSEYIMAQVKRSQSAINDTTCGLLTYQLKPKVLKGDDLLYYMVQHRLSNLTFKSHFPRKYLDVICTGQQLKYLEQDATDLKISNIMSYSHGQSERIKLAARRLDILGCVKSYCGVQNDPKRLGKLKKKLEFSRSIAEIAMSEGK